MHELDAELVSKLGFTSAAAFIALVSIPCLRNSLGEVSCLLVAFAIGVSLLAAPIRISYFQTVACGIITALPFLAACEGISLVAKQLEIYRGSQMAEQLFVQGRGGPIEGGLTLLSIHIALQGGSAELFYQVLRTSLTSALPSLHELRLISAELSTQLQNGYEAFIYLALPLASLCLTIDLIAGLLQRVTKKNLFLSEIQSLRPISGILFLLALFAQYEL